MANNLNALRPRMLVNFGKNICKNSKESIKFVKISKSTVFFPFLHHCIQTLIIYLPIFNSYTQFTAIKMVFYGYTATKPKKYFFQL
jgi:hypothetical protein